LENEAAPLMLNDAPNDPIPDRGTKIFNDRD
jgi:hypothetical protein